MSARLAAFLFAFLGLVLAIQPASSPVAANGGLTLTILHNNDAASQLIPIEALQRIALGEALTPDDIDTGIAEFKALVDAEVSHASGHGRESIILSGGNSTGAGPILQASNQPGSPDYDAIAMRLIGYDAAVLGARDFEDGPDQLGAFLCGLVMRGGGFDHPTCGNTGRAAFPMLSANLDFSGEPVLQEFVETGGIAASTVVTKGEHRIGVIGITNPLIHTVSSPGNVRVDANVARSAQAEADKLAAQGIDKVILLANLETEDLVHDLLRQTQGIDVIVSGAAGGLLPHIGYPEIRAARDGTMVPVVVTAGGYQQLGKLVVDFDGEGNITRIDRGSGLIPLRDATHVHTRPDLIVQNAVERPVLAFIEHLAVNVIGRTEIALDGRVDVLESQDSHLGDLMADAVLWIASENAPDEGLPEPDISLINGGALRLQSIKQPGEITALETYAIAPFPSFVTIVEDVTPDSLKAALENGFSRLPDISGRFPHAAGMTVTYDATAPVGSRVLAIVLDGGTVMVEGGSIVQGAPNLTLATFDFLVRGGDDYHFGGNATIFAVSYQQALERFIRDGLGGVVSASDYPPNSAREVQP